MKTIMLHGVLEQFGKEFSLDVMSCREATHAIASQIPEFKLFMLQAEQNGMRFAVFADEKNIGEADIDNLTAASVIHIVPKIMGSGGDAFGWLQVVAGAAMVVVGLGLTPFTGGTSLGLVGAGVGLMIGGAASLLMPTPKMDGSQDEDGNKANYGFGGAVTTVAQGNPVPVLYGRRYIGGFICSAGIYTEDAQ